MSWRARWSRSSGRATSIASTIEVQGVTLRVASAPLPEPPLPGTALRLHFPADNATLIPEDVA